MQRAHTESSGLPILVIEDEEAILRGLCDVLAFQGYAPISARRGDTGLERALESDPALVLLDLMLPGLDGFSVCERLREAKPSLPILMLTARGAEEDVLRGFRCGADDYVTKPFSVSELVARVAALLRRTGRSSEPAAAVDQDDASRPSETGDAPREPFEFGPWSVEPEARIATRDQRSIELTGRDLEVLAFFHRERGRILSRRRLLAEVWGYADPERIETRSVDMHIAKLRKKLGPDDGALIETVRGEGYRFRG